MSRALDKPTIVASWLQDARSDLELACVKKKKTIRYEHLCFHAQQAAEKSIKAVLIHLGLDVPRTHDLAFLLDRLPTESQPVLALMELPILTKYAVQCRYPGQELEVSQREYIAAIQLATDALRWASRVCRLK